MFQSTHPLGVRLMQQLITTPNKVFQSTHPLGVRLNQLVLVCVKRICFNPRTHSGCDCSFTMGLFNSAGFNPRTHSGCDRHIGVEGAMMQVSIHAPTRGATYYHGTIKRLLWFQSTHPLGVRHKYELSHIIVLSFNPRTHSGCDIVYIDSLLADYVSIHAPTRGATSPLFL